MGALPRPEIGAGPHRDLVVALHRLHHEAGWPSLRAMAREVGCSPTTVSTVFSSPRLPSWGVLELVIEALDGDAEDFHELWCAAGEPDAAVAPRRRVQLAGRRRELAALGRHLSHGDGRLLLVTGEAGIGKTALVDAAGQLADGVVVVAGSCLPLATEVPLLPVTELLRGVHEHDGGQLLKQVLADCPSYVGGAIAPLLPELERSTVDRPTADGGWERQRLFGAIRAVLTALGEQGRFAALIEDLHWADSATLDLLDYLLAAPEGREIPIVGTYRTADPETTPQTTAWRLRTERRPRVDGLDLGPLTREESAEQLDRLGHHASREIVDRIHDRAAGHPLFVEQLAAESTVAAGTEDALPRRLADLLDQRLIGVRGDQWRVARALGIADRGLTSLQLQEVTSLPADALSGLLHDLDERRLLGSRGDAQVRLRHPLLAEAIRSRMVPGEAQEEHGRIATTLAGSPAASAAEVAEHWRRAGAAAEELEWRIAAARSAARRFAVAQAADQWRRALALWPAGGGSFGSPPVTRTVAYLGAMDALNHVDVAAGWAVAQEAMEALPDRSGPDAAETYQRAAEFTCFLSGPESALRLLEVALRIYETLPACAGHAHALARRQFFESSRGDEAAAGAAGAAALRIAREVGEPALVREMLGARAGDDANRGDASRALSRIEEARAITPPDPDPATDIYLAIVHSLVLQAAGADTARVVAAGRPGLEAAESWAIANFPVSVLRSNLGAASRRAGDVGGAADLVDPATEESPTQALYPAHYERAVLDALRGRPAAALDRIRALAAFPVTFLANRLECAQSVAIVRLWCGRQESALHGLMNVLEECPTDEYPDLVGELLVLAVRAAADLAELRHDRETATGIVARLNVLRDRGPTDPLGADQTYGDRTALAASWTAERLRLEGRASVDAWLGAAAHWDRRTRPHDAAYCRWRAAQAAGHAGARDVASRLLRTAARDARGHVPLREAIETALHQMHETPTLGGGQAPGGVPSSGR